MIDINVSNKISDDLIISNDLLCLLQQVDILFNTDVCDVLGDENFGTSYDKYLYTLGMSNSALEAKILDDLYKLELFNFVPSVSVTIVEGSHRDIAFVDITFSGEYEDYNKTYIIK